MTAVARARGVSLTISHRSAGVEIARSITHPSAQASFLWPAYPRKRNERI